MPALYLDSNVVISLVEDDPPGKSAVAARLAALAGPRGSYVVSDLVRLECRVKPVAVGDAALLGDYDSYFGAEGLALFTPTSRTYDRATEIRARHGYETADALHLAAAIEAGCDVFVTADRRLSTFPGIDTALLTPEDGQADRA